MKADFSSQLVRCGERLLKPRVVCPALVDGGYCCFCGPVARCRDCSAGPRVNDRREDVETRRKLEMSPCGVASCRGYYGTLDYTIAMSTLSTGYALL
jgi:hypothetical protein